MLLAALAVGVLGALVEMLLLRRIYRAPELFQLLATFALVLVIKDAALWLWGPEDLLGPRAPGLSGSVDILGRRFPTYDLFLIVVGPLVLGAAVAAADAHPLGHCWCAPRRRTARWSARSASTRPGCSRRCSRSAPCSPALGGALQLPREPANLELDLALIGEAFVVVVVGGMGSISGAFVAALLIAEIKAICIGVGRSTCSARRFRSPS